MQGNINVTSPLIRCFRNPISTAHQFFKRQSSGGNRKAYLIDAASASPASASPNPSTFSKPNIIDKVFNDEEIFSGPKIQGLKGNEYVTGRTPVAKDFKQVRGVYAFMFQYFHSLNLMKSTPVTYGCKYFTGYYFPPWHFLACARKSRPSILAIFSKGKEYNGHEYPQNMMLAIKKSRNPMNFAFSRRMIAVRSRRTFFKQFEKDPNSVDGLYMIQNHFMAPFDNTTLEAHMAAFVSQAAVKAVQGNDWVTISNKRVKWDKVNQLCKDRYLPSFPKIAVGSCLNWRKDKGRGITKS